MEWKLIKDGGYPIGKPVLGFSPDWIDDDFNPNGIRECFTCDEEEWLSLNHNWVSAKWSNYQDVWFNDFKTTPTHWMELPTPPKSWKILI